MQTDFVRKRFGKTWSNQGVLFDNIRSLHTTNKSILTNMIYFLDLTEADILVKPFDLKDTEKHRQIVKDIISYFRKVKGVVFILVTNRNILLAGHIRE